MNGRIREEEVWGQHIHRELVGRGWKVSRPRVARLVRAIGIASRICRRRGKTTDSSHALPVASNLLDRRFFLDRFSQVWVSDITYLPSQTGACNTLVPDSGSCSQATKLPRV